MKNIILTCPCCEQPMTMIDIGDSCKELRCAPCGVTKTFSSWREQEVYEKEYAKTVRLNIPLANIINDLNVRILKIEQLVDNLNKKLEMEG